MLKCSNLLNANVPDIQMPIDVQLDGNEVNENIRYVIVIEILPIEWKKFVKYQENQLH